MPCYFQKCGILTSVDSDEHVQPPVKLRNIKWCSVSSLTLIEYSSDEQRLWSDCAYAQSDLRLCWSHILHCWKFHVAAQLYQVALHQVAKLQPTSHYKHCGHTCTCTTTAIWVSSLIPVLKSLSHHVQCIHLIKDKRPKMLGFRKIFVHQIHIVSFSFKIIWKL